VISQGISPLLRSDSRQFQVRVHSLQSPGTWWDLIQPEIGYLEINPALERYFAEFDDREYMFTRHADL
jgi:hypothetical protein